MPKQSEAKAERVIALLAGESGAGKSWFIANLKHALIFDTDIGGGLRYADERIARNGSERVMVGSYPELLDELARRRGQLNDFNTIAVDHLSSLHQEAVIRWNPGMKKDFGAAADKASREWRKVREAVRWGDFHLFCTAHLKGKWADEKVIGDQGDAAKNIQGDFDVVVHVYNDGKFDQFPKQAQVIKWRRDPEDLRGRIPAAFPFSLKKFLDIHGLPLEGPRQEIPMATEAQINELSRLLGVVKLGEGVLEKWMAKAKAETFSDFTADAIGKCIAHLEGLVSRPAPDAAKEGKP